MINKKKLLIFHPALAPYRVDFFNSLNQLFDLIIIFERYNVAEQKFNQNILRKNLHSNFEYLKFGFSFLRRNIRFSYISKLFKYKPDIIFCSEFGLNTFFSILYRFIFLKNVKIYVITDDSINDYILRNYFRKYITKLVFNYIDGLIVTNDIIKNYLDKKYILKILVFPIIHNEIIFKNIKYENDIINITNKNILDYKLTGKKVILSVSRLANEKNIDFLIKVFKKLNKSDVLLVIVGSGYLENSLKFIVQKYAISDNVIFTGRLEENYLKAWYALSQLFVLPSIKEPFGAVVNEALIFGNFILCSNLAGSACLINDKNGFLFSPTNESELLSYLTISLNNIKPINILTKFNESRMPYSFNNRFNEFINLI